MKQTVLTQRFQFYTIEPYRDHSAIDSKIDNQIHEDLDLELDNVDFFSTNVIKIQDARDFSRILRGKFKLQLHNRNEYKRKNTKYFYSDEPGGEAIRLDNWNSRVPTFYTTKERHLLKHYGRPLSTVIVDIHERSITIDGDTISVRYYIHRKSRQVNCKYFKKSRSAYGFKINFKTGNIITYEGVKVSRIRQNNFKHLMQVVMTLFARSSGPILHDWSTDPKNTHPINNEAKAIFNDDEFVKCLMHSILSKLPHNQNIISNTKVKPSEKVVSIAMEAFVDINKIKVPNNYQKLLIDAYPTKKALKKNENKLIASILDRLGIKSKTTIRLLHKYPDLDIKKLLILARYFGYSNLHKYLHNINEKFFILASNKKEDPIFDSIYQALHNRFEYDIKDSERKCLLKLINEFFGLPLAGYRGENDGTLVDDKVFNIQQFNTFNDHLDLLIKLRGYFPDIEMRASNAKDFHNEHLEFSKLDRAIKKGYSIKYVFEERLIRHIEDPIFVRDEYDNLVRTFYPVLLKIDAEYTEEGSHMHHCVASYADRERSIIVSLREDSPTGNERVTCEFDVNDKSCVQSKYFCNAAPPERFEFALEKLKHRISIFKGSIKSKSKEKIPLIINGVEIIPKETDIFNNVFQLF